MNLTKGGVVFMKKLLKRMMVVTLFLSLCIPMYGFAKENEEVNEPVTQIQLFSGSVNYNTASTGASGTINYKNGSANFNLRADVSASFTYRLKTNMNVQVGFYNAYTGGRTVLYTGSLTSKTVSYKPSSNVTGYFYIKNMTSGTLTVSSASVSY